MNFSCSHVTCSRDSRSLLHRNILVPRPISHITKNTWNVESRKTQDSLFRFFSQIFRKRDYKKKCLIWKCKFFYQILQNFLISKKHGISSNRYVPGVNFYIDFHYWNLSFWRGIVNQMEFLSLETSTLEKTEISQLISLVCPDGMFSC